MVDSQLMKEVHLRYISDTKPGISRRKKGDTFEYFNASDEIIKDEQTLERIKKLVIPPAWEKVWISPIENSHLQAIGYDAKKRKQYRYHPIWTQISQLQKFEHILEFAEVIPIVRKRVKQDIKRDGMPYEKILATVVWLLENTLIRVGNQEYVKENNSYGLTTLRNRHVDISGSMIHFEFKGKSGVYHKVKVQNKKVASILRRCQDLPGQELFEYIDDEGQRRTVTSEDVNEYLKDTSQKEITAKDFRTWGGTTLAAELLDKTGILTEEKYIKDQLVTTVKDVAKHLRNKPSTCRKYYIHPTILTAYEDGYTLSNLKTHKKYKKFDLLDELDECENNVLCMLRILT
jgi:DNA topoisomerase I